MWQKLKTGSKVGIVAPSSHFKKEDLNNALNWFNTYGFVPVLGKNIFAEERFLAGSDEARADDIMEFFKSPNIDAVFCIRGGYGSARILNLLDYRLIKNNPKPIIGFSDNTALQLAIYTKTQVCSISGLTLIADFKKESLAKNTENSLFKALHLEDYTISGGQSVIEGQAEGILICGCLSIITSLLGTPYFPDLKNKILVLEDIGEEPYKVDRMFTQLRLAGIFDKISGLVLGEFYKCTAKDETDGTIEEVIGDNLRYIQKPTLINFPYTHNENRFVLPIGAKTFLDSKEKKLNIIF